MSQFPESRKVSGIVAVVAVSVTLGAVQLACGSDLTGGPASENGVNRRAKSDRADMPQMFAGRSQTISIRVDEGSAASILLRLPARLPEEAQERSSFPESAKQPAQSLKSTVACEPVVSVLTEVAKQLQPGRCVT